MILESRNWVRPEDKRTIILALRGETVHRLTVRALMLKKKTAEVIEALERGDDPNSVGAKSVESLDVRTITKAEVDPGNGSLTLHGGPDGTTKLEFTTPDNSASAVLQEILAKSGRTFEQATEEVGVVEAVLPPLLIGGIGAGLCYGLYMVAGEIAAGEEVEVKGRKAGLKRLFVWAAEMLGPTGSMALGGVVALLAIGWLVARIVKRPERTVYLPAAG